MCGTFPASLWKRSPKVGTYRMAYLLLAHDRRTRPLGALRHGHPLRARAAAPVPIVACTGGVFDGVDPMVVLANEAPPVRQRVEKGPRARVCSSALSPAPSHTIVTTRRGAEEPDANASFRTRPERRVHPS